MNYISLDLFRQLSQTIFTLIFITFNYAVGDFCEKEMRETQSLYIRFLCHFVCFYFCFHNITNILPVKFIAFFCAYPKPKIANFSH